MTATPNRTRGWDWRLTVTVRRLGPFTVGGRGDRRFLDRVFYFGGRRCVAAGGPSDHAMILVAGTRYESARRQAPLPLPLPHPLPPLPLPPSPHGVAARRRVGGAGQECLPYEPCEEPIEPARDGQAPLDVGLFGIPGECRGLECGEGFESLAGRDGEGPCLVGA